MDDLPGESWSRIEATVRRTLVFRMCSERGDPIMTHDRRSRQLRTNLNHASLSRFGGITREYQFDSPSLSAFIPGSGFSRDGPIRKGALKNKVMRDLTGSFISAEGEAPSHYRRAADQAASPRARSTVEASGRPCCFAGRTREARQACPLSA